MKIKPFGVEIWMNEFETQCKYNLAETCVASLTVEQLLNISGKGNTILDELLPMKLTYGEIEGSSRLRDNICGLYENQKRDNIVITHGAIGANALVHETMISPGDHVISICPTYQQHYSIPESFGAKLDILWLRPENDFLPDLEELESMLRPNTKLVVLNNPNNPTGALLMGPNLEEFVAVVRSSGAYILCDEVYRGTNQVGNGFAPAMADIYEKGISVSSMSKVFSLAGIRLGWIAAPREVLEAEQIIGRSQKITRGNLKILDDWVSKEHSISYKKPQAGTTALLKYDFNIPSRDFCIQLLRETGVMFTPGSVMEMEGWLRIGYANSPEVLSQGLDLVSNFLSRMESR